MTRFYFLNEEVFEMKTGIFNVLLLFFLLVRLLRAPSEATPAYSILRTDMYPAGTRESISVEVLRIVPRPDETVIFR